ncbi:TonB-dependent receptor plug domain-containing protein [Rhizorhabdus dicambivorans]|uniref:TonB-dependent receptor n=1 Tax=Rhizorhabdus dicambivorans TaxID=1850238 RepID=A0A2A4FZU9_9SPHN|nr:TonB-dependent receptor [Rhizorhabdus dicambivorans]ATE63086.1 TonB-dependent receptor [Rhizorhabdus dicambivorans]PCE43263.1 TonB-dependent receptor [Rhizorhabdus dicambivorans]
MRTFTTTTLIAALAALPAAAHADEAGDADSIIVTASRSEQKLSEAGQSVTVIDSMLIEQRQTVSVAELLRTTPGVTIARNGGPGGFTGVFIRGAQSEQTVALIDGVKINDPSSPGGGFNFADLLTDGVERIEILRGPQSVLWGSQAIGGVVNLITRAPTETPQLSATGEYGRYGTGHLTANASGTAGPVALSAGAGYLTTNGISAFARGPERDGYDLFGAHAKAVITLDERLSIDLRGLYTRSKVDLDGFAPPTFAFGDTSEYSRQEQIVGYAGINAGLFDGRLNNRLAIAYTLIDRDSYDRALTPRKTLAGRGRNLRYEYQGVAEIADWANGTFGAEHEKQSYRTFDSFSGRQKRRANTDSAYADIHLKPAAGLSMGAGIRHDDHSGFGGATTMSADTAYSPNGGATLIRASYGEGFKAPSLYQLYGDFGNPALVPEKARGFDAGITQQLLDGAIEASATWFTRKVRNQIDFDLSTFAYGNLAAVRARGVELGLKLRPAEGFTVDANYTYTKAVNRQRSDPNFGKDLARRPRNSVNVSADYAWPFGLKTGATITHLSRSYNDAGNFTRIDGYALVDVRLAYPVTDRIELFGRVENLFDQRYQTATDYGQPGRAATAGVRLRY